MGGLASRALASASLSQQNNPPLAERGRSQQQGMKELKEMLGGSVKQV